MYKCSANQIGIWILSLILISPIIVPIAQIFIPEGQIFEHLWQTVLPTYTLNTLIMIIGVCLLSAFFAIPSAWFMARCDIPGKKHLQWLLLLPLAMPSYVVAYIYTDLFDYAGPIQTALRNIFGWSSPNDYWFFDIRSLYGGILILSLALYPYLYLLARASFLEQSQNMVDVSRIHGCTPWSSFRRISLPLARPAIVVGLSLIAMETVADFATMNYFAINTLTTAVYDVWLGYGSLNAAAKIAAMVLLIIFVLLGIERISRRRQQQIQRSMGLDNLQKHKLKGWEKIGALSLCWFLVIFGFGLPFFILLEYAWNYWGNSWNQQFLLSTWHSLMIASIAALLTLLVAVIFGFVNRVYPGRLSRIPARISTMGYAMPGTILAVGVLIPLTVIDHCFNNVSEYFWNDHVGLILSGTIFAVIFAYVVRFSSISIGTIESSLSKLPENYDGASRTLGCPPLKMFITVHLPLIRKGCLVATLLVFIEAMKELPAVLLLRPFNFETLATTVFQYVSDEMLQYAALPAIILVLAGLIPLLIINRSLERSHS